MICTVQLLLIILDLSRSAGAEKSSAWSCCHIEAVWNSVVSDATVHRVLHTTQWSYCDFARSTRWAVVAPRSLHFTIIAVKVDGGRSIKPEISWTDWWQRGHPMTVSSSALRHIQLSGCMVTWLITTKCSMPECFEKETTGHSIVVCYRTKEIWVQLQRYSLNIECTRRNITYGVFNFN